MGMKSIFVFLFSLTPRQKSFATPAERLLFGMTITSKARYNASIRIKRLNQFSFFITTVLSLGLILIPLLQNSEIKLAYPSRVLNMLQIFLAVAVLVYSVINSTARYETRAERLNECGDRIKELIRQLRADIAKAPTQPVNIDQYNQRYTDISTDSENHSRADYGLALVRTPEYYSITGFPWAWELAKAVFNNLTSYFLPICLILLEIAFISDMIGCTHFLTKLFVPVLSNSLQP
jgi:hypothetical protein